MASLRYKSIRLTEEMDLFDPFNDLGLKEWSRSNEEMLRNLGRALYDIVVLDSVDQEELITWN